jgi:hypothetical protein
MARLSHLDSEGKAAMVDVSNKAPSARTATAVGSVTMTADTFERIGSGGIAKGDMLAVARIAGLMAAKKNFGRDPLVSPDLFDIGRSQFHLGRWSFLRRHFGDVQDPRTNRGRNGGAYGGIGRGARHLRYVQIHRPEHDHWTSPFNIQDGW